MTRTVMRFNRPTLKVATSEAGLTAGLAVECQVTSALVQAQPQYNTIPSTGCAGATQSPGTTGWQLVLNWLQDWTQTGNSLSQFAFEHDGEQVWFELTPDADDVGTRLTGTAFAAAGDFGGTFGDGSAGVATATWPLLNKPDVSVPPAVAATGATAGIPGTWTPAGSTPPADAAAAEAAGVTASPASDWTTGQYVQGSTAGAAGEMHYDTGAWTSGRAT